MVGCGFVGSRADEVVAQLLGQAPGGADGEAQSQLRFLSLLRRINEIRSQQHMDVSDLLVRNFRGKNLWCMDLPG